MILEQTDSSVNIANGLRDSKIEIKVSVDVLLVEWDKFVTNEEYTRDIFLDNKDDTINDKRMYNKFILHLYYNCGLCVLKC